MAHNETSNKTIGYYNLQRKVNTRIKRLDSTRSVACDAADIKKFFKNSYTIHTCVLMPSFLFFSDMYLQSRSKGLDDDHTDVSIDYLTKLIIGIYKSLSHEDTGFFFFL